MVKSVALFWLLIALSLAVHGTVLTYCVKNCTGEGSGDYNSCDSCAEIVTCAGGQIFRTTCPRHTFFDSQKGECDWTSTTCTETNSESTSTIQPDSVAVQSNSISRIIHSSTSDAQSTTVQTTDKQTSVKTFMYIKVQYKTVPCVTKTQALLSVGARSKTECGVLCKRTTTCWYFLYMKPRCLLYGTKSPPCLPDIYSYVGWR